MTSSVTIGDLQIVGTPPPRLGAALAIVANTMHQSFAADKGLKEDISYRSCILASLTVRDFLRRIGMTAEVEPCLCFIEAYDILGNCLHTLGIGIEDHRRAKATSIVGWSGHLVCVAEGWLIDTTLFQARRPMWKDLPGMLATPLREVRSAYGLTGMAGLSSVDPKDGSYCRVRWLHQPKNRLWRKAGDTGPGRRLPVINLMVQQFEEAEDAARTDRLERER